MKRCSRCERDLPRDAFARRSASPRRPSALVPACLSEWARVHRPRRYKLGPEVPPGHKWCRRCEETKPETAFARNASMKDGLQGHCRDCQADAYRSRRRAQGHVVRPATVPEGHKFCRGCQTSQAPLGWSREPHARVTGSSTRCKECARARGSRDHLRTSYGLTEDDVAELLAEPGRGVRDLPSGTCSPHRPRPRDRRGAGHALLPLQRRARPVRGQPGGSRPRRSLPARPRRSCGCRSRSSGPSGSPRSSSTTAPPPEQGAPAVGSVRPARPSSDRGEGTHR